jgi:integrase
MVKSMPDPYIPKHTTFYWYRQRVPGDISAPARGHIASVAVNGLIRQLKIGAELKVTLDTKDPAVAKVRARDVQDQFDLIWASFRTDEVVLNHKQSVALAGEVYRAWKALEDNPVSSELWEHVRAENADAKTGRPTRHPLTIGEVIVDPMEERFGPFVDVVLRRHHLRIDAASRRKVLEQTARALDEVAALLGRRADGDYSPDAKEAQIPAFDLPPAPVRADNSPGVTFEDIIKAEEEHRRIGLGAKALPMPPKTKRKFQTIADEFAAFRGDGGARADSVTFDELERWKLHLLTTPTKKAGEPNGARTVAYKVGNIKTILSWGVSRFKGNQRLSSALASIQPVELPGFVRKPSDVSAIRPDEAIQVLRAARRQSDPRTRWLPWLCAYTGARINEVANLHREDFLESEGFWFFKINTSGGRSVKTASSVRYVAVHPALEVEGFRQFVEDATGGRLFASGADDVVRDWFWDKAGAGITRKGVSPNHGWRHLFEDLCIRDGVADSAKDYMTGRVQPGSAKDYGKTLARLPGLHREISKVVAFRVN